MTNLARKLAVATVSTAIAVAALVWLAPGRKAAGSVELRRVDEAAIAELSKRALLPGAVTVDEVPTKVASSELTGIGPLEVHAAHFPRSSFRRFALGEADVAKLEPGDDSRVLFDPFCQLRYKAFFDGRVTVPSMPGGGWRMRMNDIGTRDDENLLPQHPDLRVLVTGDSHTDGVCDNHESFANVLEADLRQLRPEQTVETLNAARGGYTFFNYLGVLERFLPLEPDVLIVGIYGGNDFSESLKMHYVFHASRSEPPAKDFWPLINQAYKVDRDPLSQAFIAIKSLTASPGAAETTLQVARDVSTEIAVTCWRHGIRPIFVYIPAFTQIEREDHPELVARLSALLELAPTDLDVLDRIGDSYLEHLRALRVDSLDLRPVFRASDQPLYWTHDWHINTTAQRLIARELQPLVDAARPSTAQRVRATARMPHHFANLMSPGAPTAAAATRAWASEAPPPQAAVAVPVRDDAWYQQMSASLKLSSEPLVLPQIDQQLATTLFPLGPDLQWDPVAWTRLPASVERRVEFAEHPEGGWRRTTNSLGLHGRYEPAQPRPRLRIVCAGEERAFGSGASDECWPALVEHELRKRHAQVSLEVWNAFAPGATLQQQLGTFERLRPQLPDVFVISVSGVVDFIATLRASKLVARAHASSTDAGNPLAPLPPPPADLSRATLEAMQRLHDRARDGVGSVETALELVLEAQRRCADAKARLIVLYAPSRLDVQRTELEPELAAEIARLELDLGDFGAVDSLASLFLRQLRERGVETVDLRTQLGARGGAAFWRSNSALNLEGQRIVAQELTPVVANDLSRKLR